MNKGRNKSSRKRRRERRPTWDPSEFIIQSGEFGCQYSGVHKEERDCGSDPEPAPLDWGNVRVVGQPIPVSLDPQLPRHQF